MTTYLGFTTDPALAPLSGYLPVAGGTVAGSLGVTGTLGVTGLLTGAGGLQVTGGSVGAGSVLKSAANGMVIQGVTGSSYDFAIVTPSGAAFVLRQPTGTQNLVGLGTFIGTRLIGDADVASAIAKGVFSDGSYSTHDAAVTSALGLLTSFTNASNSGSFFAGKAQLQTTVAGTTSNYGFHSASVAEHTSGTITQIKGIAAIAWAAGNGGTTTNLVGIEAGLVTRTGAVATNAFGVNVTAPDNVGTITNLYGINVASMTAGGTLNYALKTNGGRVGFGSLPTSASGLASGDLWSNSNVINIVP